MARISKIVLNKNGESGNTCLVPDLRENAFSFSPLEMKFAVGLSYVSFIYWAMFPLCPLSGEVLFLMYYHKSVSHFVKIIFCIYWVDHIAFILQFINMVYVIDWFAYVDVFLYSWDKPHLIMVYEHFNGLLQYFC